MAISLDARARIVAEAREWILTPYHHCACVKGAGVDCLMLLVGVYRNVGLLSPDFEPPKYAPQWGQNRDEEKYLDGLKQFAEPTGVPEPGDIAMFKFGRTVSHGAIIVDETFMIHAYERSRQVDYCERALLSKYLHSYWRYRL